MPVFNQSMNISSSAATQKHQHQPVPVVSKKIGVDDNGNNLHLGTKSSSLDLECDDYQKAVAALNSLQSNAQVLKSIVAKTHPQQQPASNATHVETLVYLQSTGLTLEQMDSLKLVHVAGTKGKGSTCAFVESILRSFGLKTGFFSSPHLVSVRERIRINGEPLSRRDFTRYFFEVYNRMLRKNDTDMPAYFRFLTCMAIYVFYHENVDVGILEVGIGGTHDSTNIIRKPIVVGITSLGLDHQSLLGNTLEEITLQKAGIMKSGAPVFTTSTHPSHILNLLQGHADKTKCPLFVAPPLAEYSTLGNLKLGINGHVSHVNAALALQLANAFLTQCCPEKLCSSTTTDTEWTYGTPYYSLLKGHIDGLQNCRWDGRFQTLKPLDNLTYYLDGAHTIESLNTTKDWFLDSVCNNTTDSKHILVFHVTGERSIKDHLLPLTTISFDQVIFCPLYVQSKASDNWSVIRAETNTDVKCQQQAETWASLTGNDTNIRIFSSPCQVIEYLDSLACDSGKTLNEMKQKKSHSVLVTGSLHLVGSFLSVLGA